ncbi:MAG: phosphoadenylyl-sulfate reductase [Chloroflexi bacterium]|nr:phosphoadenylyl-sulfate reductase [Chloroflexota bacterium]MYC01378.1 phosphoadenylyl-sulfate reductase [Chloroflexota bacterium]
MSTLSSAFDATQIDATAARLASAHPSDIIAKALAQFERLTVSFSGAEDVVLIDFASREAEKLGKSFRVFTLDTGRMHPETLEFIERVSDHYDIPIEAYSPQADAVEALVREKGLFSFRVDGHQECCGIRKVEPLGRALADVEAYVTGQRKDQSPGTRADIPVVQLDPGFGRADAPLIKFNPLANWSSAQVWQQIMAYGVPYNPLHDQGFKSIGCAPCTRATHPGEHERAGRWWWEEATQKECGLHSINLER